MSGLKCGTGYWYQVVDGVAVAVPDTQATRDAIDKGTMKRVYADMVSAIVVGRVIATAFERKTEPVYDAVAYLQRREWIQTGTVTRTKILAARQSGPEWPTVAPPDLNC